MRACRTEPLRAALVAALLAGACPAMAQLGAPIPLVPPPPPTQPGGSAAPAAVPDVPKGFEEQSLAPTDASWTGVLGDAQGAMPETMWRGTPRNFVAAALPLLQPTSSPELQSLARRLLLSNAVSPAGPDVADRPSLAAARLDRLMALGDVEGAVAMMDQLPADPTGDGMDRTRVELRFAANDQAGACKAIDGGVAQYQSVWWARALIACQALGGDGAKATLGQSLLREQKAPTDAAFDALIDTLTGRPRKIEKLGDPTPMRLTLLAAAKLPLPPDALASAGPAALLAYASTSDAGLPVERAAFPPRSARRSSSRSSPMRWASSTSRYKSSPRSRWPRSRTASCPTMRNRAPSSIRPRARPRPAMRAPRRSPRSWAARGSTACFPWPRA